MAHSDSAAIRGVEVTPSPSCLEDPGLEDLYQLAVDLDGHPLLELFLHVHRPAGDLLVGEIGPCRRVGAKHLAGRLQYLGSGPGLDLAAVLLGHLVIERSFDLVTNSGVGPEDRAHRFLVLAVDPAHDVAHRVTAEGGGVHVGSEHLERLGVPVVAVGHGVPFGVGGVTQPRRDAHGHGPVVTAVERAPLRRAEPRATRRIEEPHLAELVAPRDRGLDQIRLHAGGDHRPLPLEECRDGEPGALAAPGWAHHGQADLGFAGHEPAAYSTEDEPTVLGTTHLQLTEVAGAGQSGVRFDAQGLALLGHRTPAASQEDGHDRDGGHDPRQRQVVRGGVGQGVLMLRAPGRCRVGECGGESPHGRSGIREAGAEGGVLPCHPSGHVRSGQEGRRQGQESTDGEEAEGLQASLRHPTASGSHRARPWRSSHCLFPSR